ncbi:hypothetical protein THTE_3993 [Thermogutta terrifontis]|uniref:Uncharacterized protein n=1 Tax=Thermogutta terrifontis TaxID=1331910 RepID=A0A286RKW2_9BACT|nr:hypothetical protein THTE_3993 [Thermogutta terrifontis]
MGYRRRRNAWFGHRYGQFVRIGQLAEARGVALPNGQALDLDAFSRLKGRFPQDCAFQKDEA